MANRVRKVESKIERLIRKWEKDYKAEKAKEVQELHNAIAEVITNHPLPVILTTLEIVKHELLNSKLQQIKAGASVEEAVKS